MKILRLAMPVLLFSFLGCAQSQQSGGTSQMTPAQLKAMNDGNKVAAIQRILSSQGRLEFSEIVPLTERHFFNSFVLALDTIENRFAIRAVVPSQRRHEGKKTIMSEKEIKLTGLFEVSTDSSEIFDLTLIGRRHDEMKMHTGHVTFAISDADQRRCVHVLLSEDASEAHGIPVGPVLVCERKPFSGHYGHHR